MSNFGYATYLRVKALTTKVNSSCYTAPEIKTGKTYDGMKSDVFSLGVVLFVLAMGVYPFFDSEKSDLFYGLLMEEKLEQYWTLVGGLHLSANLRDLIKIMLNYEPDSRPNIAEILLHPWMAQKYCI